MIVLAYTMSFPAYLRHMLIRAKHHALAITLLCISSYGNAQSYPAKTVRLIVPFPTGGGTDAMARFAAQKLTVALGRQFVVDNRAGAGGAIGAELAAKSAPDGYTLLQAGVATHAVLPHLKKNLPYDPLKDFDAVCLMATAPAMLAVHPSLPVRNLREFITLLNKETVAAIKSDDLTAKLIADASLPIAGTAEEFGAHIRDEHARIGKVIREARISLE